MMGDIYNDQVVTGSLLNSTKMFPNNTIYVDVMDGNGADGHHNASQMSVTIEMLVDQYLNGIIGLIVIVLGLVGNLLTVIVLTRKTMHSSTNCFLTALAIWDMMVLLGSLLLMTLQSLSAGYREHVFPFIVVYFYPLALVAQTSTVWITVSFTVERYIAVCHPLKAARMCTIARARIVIVMVCTSAFLYNLCRWFEYEIVYDEIPDEQNRTVIKKNVSKTDFGLNRTYNTLYFFWFYLFVMFLIPLSSLAVLNTALILAVKKSQKQQKDMNVRQSRENNVTIMLVSVVMVFMFCQVPALVYNVAYAIDVKTVTETTSWTILSPLRNFMVTFNSAVNFMLYCAFGQKFRRVFMRTFCQCLLSEEDFNSMTYHGNMTHVANSQAYSKSKYGKYMRLIRRNKPVNRPDLLEMSTTHTVLSKYSPNYIREHPGQGKYVLAKFQNGRYQQKIKDHPQDKSYLSSGSQDNMDMIRHVLRSTTPSPV